MQLTTLISTSNNGNCCFPKGAVNQGGGHNPIPQKQEEREFLKSLAPPLMATILTLSPLSITSASHARAVDVQKGAALFRKTCIGCHAAGGNIIQPGATLFTKDLQRNGIDTEEEIYRVTYFGNGRMPGFDEKCAPRGLCTFGARLQDEEIKILAEFVNNSGARNYLLQADQNWPNIVVADSSFRLRSFYARFTSQK